MAQVLAAESHTTNGPRSAPAESPRLDLAQTQVSTDRAALLVRPELPRGASTRPALEQPASGAPIISAVHGGAGASPGVQRIRAMMDQVGGAGPRVAAAFGAVENAGFQIDMTQAQFGADAVSVASKQASGAATVRNSVGADTERMLATVESELARRQRDGAEGEAADAKYRAIRSVNVRAGQLAVSNVMFIQNVQGQLSDRLDVAAYTGKLDAGTSAVSADRGSELAHFFDQGGPFSNSVNRFARGIADESSRVGETFSQFNLLPRRAAELGRARPASVL